MFFDNPQNKLICVFGLGLSGLSTARYLDRIKKEFFVIDSRVNPPGKESLKELSSCVFAHFGEIPQDKLNNALMIILSPGVSPSTAEIQHATKKGVKIVGDIEVFVNQTKKKIIAITGSNGKSTVTDLTNRLLLASGNNSKIGGNFGLPVLDYLPQDNADVYVLELSSFQLDTTQSLKADVAVVLNITEDHMDRYASFEEYRNSKLSIFNHAKIAIANADDKQIKNQYENKHKLFSLNDHASDYYIDTEQMLTINHNKIISAKSLRLAGQHNWSNALVALAILTELKIDLCVSVLNKLKEYGGLEHRFQLIAFKQNIEWVNDSKATNVGATKAALAGINKSQYANIILIAGGDAKGADLSELKLTFETDISHLVLIGKDAKLFSDLVSIEKIYYANNMLDAVSNAKKYVMQQPVSEKKSMILLSPACASLDMYQNFEARGKAFVSAMKQVVEVNGECA